MTPDTIYIPDARPGTAIVPADPRGSAEPAAAAGDARCQRPHGQCPSDYALRRRQCLATPLLFVHPLVRTREFSL